MKRRGKTKQNKQRFRCNRCAKSFIWKKPFNKHARERHWFELWVKESCSVRFLSDLSGHSEFKLKRIKNDWLQKTPVASFDFSTYAYLLYDATYFHQDGCLMSLMNVLDQKVIAHTYVPKEGFKTALPWFESLKAQGLNPRFLTMDGEQSVMRTIRMIWPNTKIQRCLYHIRHEALRWLRTNPKTQAGRDLRNLLKELCSVRTVKERDRFIDCYNNWLAEYKDFVRSLPKGNFEFRDLKRTIVLIDNALPDMFHYLDDPNVPHTTNTLESFHSRLKPDYRKHRGLTKPHRISYLNWYCYFKNQGK